MVTVYSCGTNMDHKKATGKMARALAELDTIA
jgi:hypothetical protein